MIGSGGSILTVPVLVYLFHVEPSLATAYSLFIVGTTALVGGIRSGLHLMVGLKTAVVFSIPSFIAVYLTRRWLMPLIPQELFSLSGIVLTRDMAIMVFFSLIMLATALSRIKAKTSLPDAEHSAGYNYPRIMLEGIIVGALTGIAGAGRGFLIIPALVLFVHIPMKKAVGTSLLIIAAKSLIGFLGDIGSGQTIDFRFMLLISAIAVGGIFLGSYFSRFVDGNKLKAAFGWFVLLMGTYILLKETVFS